MWGLGYVSFKTVLSPRAFKYDLICFTFNNALISDLITILQI